MNFTDLTSYMPNDTGAIAWVGIVFALLECFFGFKLKKLWSSLVGFFIGFCLGGALGIMLFSADERCWLYSLIFAVVLGLIGGAVAFTFYRIGTFFYMLATTFTFVYSFIDGLVNLKATDVNVSIFGLYEQSVNIIALVSGLILGLVVGLLTLKFMRMVTIITTSLSNGFVASYLLFNGVMAVRNIFVIILVAVVLIVLGIWFQMATTKPKPHKKWH